MKKRFIVLALSAVILLSIVLYVIDRSLPEEETHADNFPGKQDGSFEEGNIKQEQYNEEYYDPQESEDNYYEEEIKRQDIKPVLHNLAFDIDDYNEQTGLAGDLVFDKVLLYDDGYISNDKVFLELGHVDKLNPDDTGTLEMWFHVPLGTKARSPVNGTISLTPIKHSKDYSVNINNENSIWIVSVEHLVDLEVEEGDKVEVGQILGTSTPRKTYNYQIAMSELAVWTPGDIKYKYCPFDFLREDLKPIYEEKIHKLTNDWEEFIGKDVYNQEAWVSPGCIKERVKEE